MFPTFSDVSQHFQIVSQHFHMFPNIFRCVPTFSDGSQHFQMFPNIFRLFPTFCRCFPTFSDVSQHFQICPTIFRFVPTFSDFTYPHFPFGTNKLTLGPVDLFDQKKCRSSSFWDFGELEFENDRGNTNSNINPNSWC